MTGWNDGRFRRRGLESSSVYGPIRTPFPVLFGLTWQLMFVLLCPSQALAQHAQLSGVVRDTHGGVIIGADVQLADDATGTKATVQSNERGVYVFASIRPSTYRLEVVATGFSIHRRSNLTLHVDQRTVLDIVMAVAGLAEDVEVSTRRALLGMADGSVGTVIDRQFAADLPVRGRSFSALVALAPGVNRIPAGVQADDGSEFHVNGQRNVSNALSVDGVSAPSEPGSDTLLQGAGQRFSSTVTGTVNGGVSMDSVQEVRIQTSTFAAEFGRTPGAQISLVTRSGTNRFSGSAFEQVRHDALMANDWFANSRGVAKPTIDEHQFGGALGGRVLVDRLFFFASYEGLRLRQPRFVIADVPSVEARERADVSTQQILAAYPDQTGPTRFDGSAEHAAFYPLRHSSDTFGIRLDHVMNSSVRLFGRYSRVPSDSHNQSPFAAYSEQMRNARSVTSGLTATVKDRTLIELRGSYSQADFSYGWPARPALGGWLPRAAATAWGAYSTIGLSGLFVGDIGSSVQKQANVVASLSHVRGRHHLKMGFDQRQLWPSERGHHGVSVAFESLSALIDGKTASSVTVSKRFPMGGTFRNTSVYIQDDWKPLARLSVTYGARWDLNPAPSFDEGEGPLAVNSFEPIRTLSMVPRKNVALWKTNYGNVFPRLGTSYALDHESRTVLSGGLGIFGDLEGSAAGAAASNVVGGATQVSRANVSLPLSDLDVEGSSQSNLNPPYGGLVAVVDPGLETPRITEWNVAVQRALRSEHVASVTYVGARGTRLLQTQLYYGLNTDFPDLVKATTARGRSEYHALQVQYRGRFTWGIRSLISYTLGRARDTSSSLGSLEGASQLSPADSDVRHSVSAGMSWTLPNAGRGGVRWFVDGWGVHVLASGRSGYPFSVWSSASFVARPGEEAFAQRASLVPGIPTIIDDPSVPGGSRLNRAAFVDPPVNEQGTTGRNAFRGLAAYQVDAALERTVPVAGSSRMRIRIEAFNLFNTPVFALPSNSLGAGVFGVATRTVASEMDGLYTSGGPRSVAMSVRVEF